MSLILLKMGDDLCLTSSSTVVSRGENDIDVEVGGHVLVEVGDEGIAVVGDGRGREAIPGDPAIDEGPTDVPGGRRPKWQGIKPTAATIIDREKVSVAF